MVNAREERKRYGAWQRVADKDPTTKISITRTLRRYLGTRERKRK
jgi:hypothetical protein